MSWFAGVSALERRRKRLEARQAALAAAGSAPPLHPVLGLGGRSIELSLARGLEPDGGAYELAIDELTQHVAAGDQGEDELRAAARWLDEQAHHAGAVPPGARERLAACLAALTD